MKISYQTDYALKIILDLARNYQNRLVHISEISKRQDIPQKFLEQLLLKLKQGGFVQSKKGPKGGYSLSKEPSEILLGDIIRFMTGSLFPIACVDPRQNHVCDFKWRCVFTEYWEKIEQQISSVVDSVSFEELAEKESMKLQKYALDFQI